MSAPAPAAPTAEAPAAGQGGLQPQAAASGGEAFPPELVHTVEELIRLTGEYNALAAQVTDIEAFKQHREQLSTMETQLSPLVEDIMIAQSKMTPQQQAEFDRQYYDTRAKPLVDERYRQKQRIDAMVLASP
jgi:hypothetical protein